MTQKFDYNKDKAEFTREMINDTLKYQKKYGFKLGENNSAHNNEGDAFRHTYMQSIMANRYGTLPSKAVSFGHEFVGKIKGQDSRESNMDMWNNQQGQQIYNEVRREYPNFNKLSEQQQKDIIAEKVVQRMRKGKLITGLNDHRKFQVQKPSFTPMPWIGGVHNNGKPLGFATDIDTEQIANMLGIQSSDIKSTNQPKQNSGLFGYTNPLTGSNHIYTREEVGSMSSDEFAKHEKEIDAPQTKALLSCASH